MQAGFPQPPPDAQPAQRLVPTVRWPQQSRRSAAVKLAAAEVPCGSGGWEGCHGASPPARTTGAHLRFAQHPQPAALLIQGASGEPEISRGGLRGARDAVMRPGSPTTVSLSAYLLSHFIHSTPARLVSAAQAQGEPEAAPGGEAAERHEETGAG